MSISRTALALIISASTSYDLYASTTESEGYESDGHHRAPTPGGASAVAAAPGVAARAVSGSDSDSDSDDATTPDLIFLYGRYLNSAHRQCPTASGIATTRGAYNWARRQIVSNNHSLDDIPKALGLINLSMRPVFSISFDSTQEKQRALYRAARAIKELSQKAPRAASLVKDNRQLQHLKKAALAFNIFHFDDILAHHETKGTTALDATRRQRWLKTYWDEAQAENRSQETVRDHILLAKLVCDLGYTPAGKTRLQALQDARRDAGYRLPKNRQGQNTANYIPPLVPNATLLGGSSTILREEKARLGAEIQRLIQQERTNAAAAARAPARVAAPEPRPAADDIPSDDAADVVAEPSPFASSSPSSSSDDERDVAQGSALRLQSWTPDDLEILTHISDSMVVGSSESRVEAVFDAYQARDMGRTRPEIAEGLQLLDAQRAARSSRKRAADDSASAAAESPEEFETASDGRPHPAKIARKATSEGAGASAGSAASAAASTRSAELVSSQGSYGDSSSSESSDDDGSDYSASDSDDSPAQRAITRQQMLDHALVEAALAEQARYTTHHNIRVGTIIAKYRRNSSDDTTPNATLRTKIRDILRIYR